MILYLAGAFLHLIVGVEALAGEVCNERKDTG
jgi:hypothetical protein